MELQEGCSPHRRPVSETKAHCPPSRDQTARRTASGTLRLWISVPGRIRVSSFGVEPSSRSTRERLFGAPSFSFLDLFEQQREGALEDRTGIARGDLATQQALQLSQPLLALLADGELHPVPRGDSGWTIALDPR
jgi:hypothetical protein